MAVALGTNIANPISTALSQWPGFDTMGKLANYGKLGATNPDAVIEALFANSEVGAWYDPSDLTTMFQDRAGTTPVTADGQTVGKILDKSGRGNHATAPSDAARPLYKTDGTYHWLQFDGVDDLFQVLNIGTNELISLFSGLTYSGVDPVSLTTNSANASVVSFYNGKVQITAGNGASSSVACAVAPKFVGTIEADGLNFSGVARRNGIDLGLQPIVGGISMGSMNKLTLGVNSNGSGNPTTVSLYSLIIRGALSTTDEITATETWVNSKTGAF